MRLRKVIVANQLVGLLNLLEMIIFRKKIEYSYDKASGDVSLDEHGVFMLPNGCTHATENSEIEVIIKWDNQSETINLTVK